MCNTAKTLPVIKTPFWDCLVEKQSLRNNHALVAKYEDHKFLSAETSDVANDGKEFWIMQITESSIGQLPLPPLPRYVLK